MAIGANTPWLARLIVPLLAAVALLLAAGPVAPQANAATACTKYGDVAAKKLRNREARSAIRCYLNRERGKRGMSNLGRDRRLQKASQKHTNFMLYKNCFSHQCPGEGSLESRLRSVNYLLGGLLRWTYGENIAYGGGSYGTPKAIVKAWMNSPGHRANILNPAFRDVGVGFASGTPGKPKASGGIYTTDFGMRILG